MVPVLLRHRRRLLQQLCRAAPAAAPGSAGRLPVLGAAPVAVGCCQHVGGAASRPELDVGYGSGGRAWRSFASSVAEPVLEAASSAEEAQLDGLTPSAVRTLHPPVCPFTCDTQPSQGTSTFFPAVIQFDSPSCSWPSQYDWVAWEAQS